MKTCGQISEGKWMKSCVVRQVPGDNELVNQKFMGLLTMNLEYRVFCGCRIINTYIRGMICPYTLHCYGKSSDALE